MREELQLQLLQVTEEPVATTPVRHASVDEMLENTQMRYGLEEMRDLTVRRMRLLVIEEINIQSRAGAHESIRPLERVLERMPISLEEGE